MRIGKLLIGLGVGFALVLSVTPAHAEPPAPERRSMSTQSVCGVTCAGSPSKTKPKKTDTTKLSKGQKSDIALGKSIIKHAVNQKRHTLDYKKADKYDKGNVKFRRQFAMGFIVRGGRVTGISGAERKKVMSYLPKGDRYGGLPKNVFGVPQCEGKTALVSKKLGIDVRYWFNSCDTALLIFLGTSTAAILGLLSFVQPEVAIVTVIVGALIAVATAWVDYKRDLSTKDSVIIRLLAGRYVTVNPQ